MTEKQELLKKAESRVKTLEQKISFRAKGQRGSYINELAKAKTERDKILFSINNNSEEAEELTKLALEQGEQLKIIKENQKEIKETLNALGVYLSYLENKDKPELVLKTTPKPNLDIGIEIRARNQERLKKAQPAFDSILQKSKGRSPMYRGSYSGELQRARNELNLVLKDIENQDGLIEFYELRAERDWLETVKTEIEANTFKVQAEIDKTKADFALLEKHGYIKAES